MGKLFLQEIPTQDAFEKNLSQIQNVGDPKNLYTTLMFSKIGNELENSLDSLLQNYGLSSGRFLMLALLQRPGNENGLKPTELAQTLGVTQATMSGLISNLEKSGYILKESNGQDARSYTIKPSESGRKVYLEVLPTWVEKLKDYYTVYTSEEIEQLALLLGKLVTQKIKV